MILVNDVWMQDFVEVLVDSYNIFVGENKSLTVAGDEEYEYSILFKMSPLGIPAFCFEDTPLGMFDFCLGIEEFRNIGRSLLY